MDIRCYLVKNETETATTAPYTWRVIPNGVANLNDIVADVLKRINSSDERVRMTLAETQKVALKHVLEGKIVDLGGIRLKLQIPGSSPCEDTPFDPTTNEVIVCAYIDDELRDTFDGIEPAKISASVAADIIKVSNIMDVATEQFGTVVGANEFVILGNGITLDGEGEYAKALDKKTGEVKGTATVQRVSKGQRAYAKFSPQLAGGNYTLEVATKGLIGETTPRIFHKPITAVSVVYPTPTITKIASEGSTGVVKTQPFSIEGTNLGYSTGDSVKIDWMSGTIAMSETVTPTAISATKLTFATVSKFNDTPDDVELTFTVKINGMTVVKKTMLLGTE